MKTKFTLAIFFLHFTSLFSQTDSSVAIYSSLDTLKYYDVELVSGPGKSCHELDFRLKKIKYWVDCKEVSEKEYMKYYVPNDQLGDCKPCYLETLDKNDHLLTAGVQYTDCPVGDWFEYYPDGKIKVNGHYKENLTGNWDDLYARGYCAIKNGTWTYYAEDGSVTKKEIYKDGVLVQEKTADG
ncbi:MAG: hypothetical protein HY064_17065 [Bacteroidetes bacterium]|nr:hypothetical protein [Bacteroidota bacterium]